jgi:glycosyltransferase involved in cell wall biosynthesis
MVIAVSTRLLQKGKFEGIGWFTYQTMKWISTHHPEHQFIFVFDRPCSEEFVFAPNVTPVVVGPPTRHPVLWYLWFEFQIPRILKKYKADIFVSPDGYLSLNTNVPQLGVIHDINFVHRPGDMPWLKAKYYNFFFPKYARKASRVATVSNYSKEDIAQSYGIERNKIDVVYSGINPFYKPIPQEDQKDVRKKYCGGAEYFLFVGALHPRKNVSGLMRAFDEFKKTGSKTKLLIVGGGMHKTGEITDTYNHLKYRDEVILTGRISDNELFRIFGAAKCLTFFPFFEGFGLPLFEAMSAGVPVVCSNVTSLPELGEDAVLYADPADIDSMAKAMTRIDSDEMLRKSLIEKGSRQKEKFSWEETAKLLWESIERIIK